MPYPKFLGSLPSSAWHHEAGVLCLRHVASASDTAPRTTGRPSGCRQEGLALGPLYEHVIFFFPKKKLRQGKALEQNYEGEVTPPHGGENVLWVMGLLLHEQIHFPKNQSYDSGISGVHSSSLREPPLVVKAARSTVSVYRARTRVCSADSTPGERTGKSTMQTRCVRVAVKHAHALSIRRTCSPHPARGPHTAG